MSKAASVAPSVRDCTDDDSTGGDVLHFLARTLRAHIIDAQPEEVIDKLRNLLSALKQQETTLADWPDSPSKDRICAALAKARDAVSQIVYDFGSVPQSQATTRIKTIYAKRPLI